jgi:hypothetical protein
MKTLTRARGPLLALFNCQIYILISSIKKGLLPSVTLTFAVEIMDQNSTLRTPKMLERLANGAITTATYLSTR